MLEKSLEIRVRASVRLRVSMAEAPQGRMHAGPSLVKTFHELMDDIH